MADYTVTIMYQYYISHLHKYNTWKMCNNVQSVDNVYLDNFLMCIILYKNIGVNCKIVNTKYPFYIVTRSSSLHVYF